MSCLCVWTGTEQRFWSRVDPCRTDGCAVWLGATARGYGQLRIDGKVRYAHHFLVGAPPAGLEWDHVRERGCTHTNCVWPDHLELVTHQVNMNRGLNGQKTHCPQGHELTPENTYIGRRRSNGAVSRSCRTCNLAGVARRRARAKGLVR